MREREMKRQAEVNRDTKRGRDWQTEEEKGKWRKRDKKRC
jgi:hypothetical protein